MKPQEVGNTYKVVRIRVQKTHTSKDKFQDILSIIRDYVFKAWEAEKTIEVQIRFFKIDNPSYSCTIEEA